MFLDILVVLCVGILWATGIVHSVEVRTSGPCARGISHANGRAIRKTGREVTSVGAPRQRLIRQKPNPPLSSASDL